MKIKYLLIILILLFIALILGWLWLKEEKLPVPDAPLKSKTELSIVAVGDSLIVGVGATPGNNLVSLLSQKIGVPIKNRGVSGDTSGEVLARLNRVLEEQPDMVILLVGGNDALQQVPVETTFQNISSIISAFQEKGASVILVGVQGNIWGDRYRERFDSLAKEYNTAYVPDILDGIIENPDYMSDIVHPNDIGYSLMANKIYEEMKKSFPLYGF
jgi:acyl-CoA thioesterase I